MAATNSAASSRLEDGRRLYTVGSSNRSADQFFGELCSRTVKALIDVRSRPSSRLQHFRRAAIEPEAQRRGIDYSWRGELLGGLNDIRTDDVGFVEALYELARYADSHRVAIFCAEGDPANCHRSWKVAAALLVRHGIEAINILRDGSEERLTTTLLRTRPADIPAEIRDQAIAIAVKAAAGNPTMRRKAP